MPVKLVWPEARVRKLGAETTKLTTKLTILGPAAKYFARQTVR